MKALEEQREKGELEPSLELLHCIPNAVHVAKCLKGSFANWWLRVGGEHCNLVLLRSLWHNSTPSVKDRLREYLSLAALRNRDRMDVSLA